MDDMERMKRESDRGYEGTRTAAGITGMVALTAAVIIILAVVAIWVI